MTQLALLEERRQGVPVDSEERREGVPVDREWTAGAHREQQRGPQDAPVCAGCREREARYGFREEHDDPAAERPRTLCFSCFRMEIARRQAVAAQLSRGWNAQQASLPLEDTIQQLTRRRRRAQIAARHALGL